MSKKSYRKVLVFFVVLLFISAGYVSAGQQEIQKKLNKQVKVELKDVTIADALDKIGKEAGVEIELSDEAEWKLPAGAATRISVLLEGSLSDGLSEMLNSFFMRYVVGDQKITIYSQKELEHIIGRPSTRQLELLKKIYCAQFSVSGKPSQEAVLKLIKDTLGDVAFLPYGLARKFEEILGYSVGEGTSRTFTFAVLLEQYSDIGNKSWYISEMRFPNEIPHIQVVSEEEFCEARLNQVVDLSFKDEIARTVIEKLCGMAGVEIVLDQQNPYPFPWNQRISVDMQNTTIREALINLINMLDGQVFFQNKSESIYISWQSRPYRPHKVIHSENGAAESRKRAGIDQRDDRGGYVGKISIPMEGGKYFLEFILTKDDLPDELRALRDKKIEEILGKVDKDKKAESDK